jgi:hypothetical protein
MAARQWVAIDSSTDRRDWALTLARAHERGLEGADAGPEVRDVIDESWRRCARSELDPLNGLAPLAISAAEAERRWDDSPLRLAEPLLRDLLADVAGAGQQVVLVCDADGTMLWIDGDPGVLEEAPAIHLERGSDWSEGDAATNAMGTALAAGHPLQVFSAEHFAVPVHDWTCSAAPVRDPETGTVLGVLDLSGELATAHPHSLALVEAAAKMIETRLAAATAALAEALRERHGDRVGRGGALALSSAAGTILASAEARLRGARLEIPPAGGEVGGELGLGLVAERVAGEGFLIWAARPRRSGAGATIAGGVLEDDAVLGGDVEPLKASFLGRDRALVDVAGGRSVELSPRHSEILLLLALRPEGLAAEDLALELYGDAGKRVSARAEVSRLRRALPGLLDANPYRLATPLVEDRAEVAALVDAGRLGAALARYGGPLLPASEAPLVAEARGAIDDRLRDAVLAAGDPAVLEAWLDNPAGRGDADAARELARRLDPGDPRRAAALSRLRRLSQGDFSGR